MYVLPYGQMSLWGCHDLASNVINFINISYEIRYNIILFLLYTHDIGCIKTCSNSSYHLCMAFTTVLILYKPVGCGARVSGSSYRAGFIAKYFSSSSPKIRSNKRIGPHNFYILSIIFGSLLGDAHAERRRIGYGTRISFYQESSHLTYLIWLHQLVSSLGYCSPNLPKAETRLGKKGLVRKTVRFCTWTYSSLNWIHELWYKRLPFHVPVDQGYPSIYISSGERENKNSNPLKNLADFTKNPSQPIASFKLKELPLSLQGGVEKSTAAKFVKVIPKNIDYYLTPLALAIWIMDDGGKLGKGLKLSTNSYSYEDCLYLVEVLFIKFKLKATIQSTGITNQYVIYIWKESMSDLREIVLPFIHPSMKYKLI